MTKVTNTIKLFVFLAFLLSLGFQARAQYAGSAQPDGTGGYNFYGSSGGYTGSARPNGTGGYNFTAPAPVYTPPPNAYAPAPRYAPDFIPMPTGRR